MTFAEFEKLPEDDGPVYHELRHGELVSVAIPRLKHTGTRFRTRRQLEAQAPAGSFVESDFPFCPLPEYEYRIADVAYVSRERWEQADPEGQFRGAPDLVVEVVSPSNTTAEMLEKEKICLENGAKEFWLVDAPRRQVKVSTPDGRTITYKSGASIPLPLFGEGKSIAVDAIFA